MRRYLETEKYYSLSGGDIRELVHGHCDIREYPDLDQVRDIGEVVSPKKPLVLLYNTSQNYGHWTCVIDQGNHMEVFDSYGIKPDSELKWTPEYLRTELHEDMPHLTHLLCGHPVIYNNVALQGKNTDTCGRWVSARINMRKLPLKDFAVKFAMTPDPDDAVVLATPLRSRPPPDPLPRVVQTWPPRP